MEKKRIDVLLVEQGFFDSREKAKRAIMAGIVHNDHESVRSLLQSLLRIMIMKLLINLVQKSL